MSSGVKPDQTKCTECGNRLILLKDYNKIINQNIMKKIKFKKMIG
jgi:hypothetical protein